MSGLSLEEEEENEDIRGGGGRISRLCVCECVDACVSVLACV